MADTNVPSDTVLDETPARALKLLGAISTNAVIRTVLEKRGYSDAEHEKGWQLILNASGYQQPMASVASRPEAADAVATLTAWDEPNFRIAGVTLIEFPEQLQFVFANLEAQEGAGAIVSVTTFLDRLDALESGDGRKGTRKADLAALAKLAARGFDAKERARLRDLLAVATASPEPAKPNPKAEKASATQEAARRQAKIALWAFFAEWSEIARTEIKRRDQLIQLGLAKRKVKKGAKKGETPEDGGEK